MYKGLLAFTVLVSAGNLDARAGGACGYRNQFANQRAYERALDRIAQLREHNHPTYEEKKSQHDELQYLEARIPFLKSRCRSSL